MSEIDETGQRTPKPQSFLSVFFRTLGISLIISYSYWVYELSRGGILTLMPEIGLIGGFLLFSMAPGLAVFLLLLMIVQRLRIVLIGFQLTTYTLLALFLLGVAADTGLITV